jgi:hypothetical protein
MKKADIAGRTISSRHLRRRAIAWSLTICALATGLAFTVPGTTAATAATRPASPSAYTAFPGRLYSVAAISANDAWAAGLGTSGSLIVHWNGRAWSQSLAGSGYFNSVAASSARDVWAVGGTNWGSPTQTLAEHWNGKTWAQVRTPNPAGGGLFNGVVATSPRNAWAVGDVGPGPGIPSATKPLIEHWNGKTWTIQGDQAPAGGGHFAAVTATSAANAWAVGWTGLTSEGSGQTTLIERWNGRAWTRVPSPNLPGSTASVLNAVTAVSADNAWAVGYGSVGGRYNALTMHWNGQHWTLLTSNTPGGDVSLLGVTASWTNNIWAVGITNPTRCSSGGPQCQTLVEHWNGVRWKVIPSPDPPSNYLNLLWGISAVSRTDIWAVGTTDYGSTLIAHWNGTVWS